MNKRKNKEFILTNKIKENEAKRDGGINREKRVSQVLSQGNCNEFLVTF